MPPRNALAYRDPKLLEKRVYVEVWVRRPGWREPGFDRTLFLVRAQPGAAGLRFPKFPEALIEFRGDGGASHDQSRDEGAEESFAPAPGVVHELEEAEIQRQLLLRDTPVWPQPGT